MGYRVKTQRGLQRVVPEEGLGAVRRAIRERNDGVALAMSFDPGTVSDLALYAHASAIMMGLLYARGWRRAQLLTAGGVPRQNGDNSHTHSATRCMGHILARSSRSPQGPTRREPGRIFVLTEAPGFQGGSSLGWTSCLSCGTSP